jgi:hypothetical protein
MDSMWSVVYEHRRSRQVSDGHSVTSKGAAEDEFAVRKGVFWCAIFGDLEFRGVDVWEAGHRGLIGWCLA